MKEMIKGFFLCLKFSTPRFFLDRKITQVFFGVADLSRDFWGRQ